MADIKLNNLIRVSDDGRYFVDHNKKPFFWLGDTQWELFRGFTLEEADMTLENRRSKGLTVIQVMITGTGAGTKPNLSGHKPWLNNDPSTPNDEYFKNVDTIIQSGNEKDIIFVLGVYHQVQVSHITTANARIYARWIAERYRDMPNIIWTTYPKAEKEFIPVLREIAVGLQEGDDGRHIICVHPDPSPASSSFIHNESWLSFNVIQTWARYDLIYKMVTSDYELTPAKPVVMAEGAYESGSEYGFPVTPLMVRKQAYWSYLSGGHHSYGHNDSWRLLPTWKAALDAPGAFQMGILKKIFTGLQWWELVPDQSILVNNSNTNFSQNLSARSHRGDWAMAYLGDPTTVSINMSKITTHGSVNAIWVDPRSGEQIKIGSYLNEGTQTFSTPTGWEDAVLIFTRI
jgi:hypothetical protein